MSHILVSPEAGSNDVLNTDGSVRHHGLAKYIMPQGRVRVARRSLPTDVIFTGRGPMGSVIEIGIEYKTIWDVLACINDGRFAGNQLPNLREFDYAFLLIEGMIQEGSDASGCRLEVYGSPMGKPRGWYGTDEWGRGKRVWTYVEFEHWYFSMMFRGGVCVLPFTRSKWDSGRRVGSLWRAFNDKAWEEHSAHLAHSKAHLAPLRGDQPAFLRAISEYGSIGPQGALAADKLFKSSMRAACAATVDQWAEMPVGGGVGKGGKRKRASRLGKKRAMAVWNELGGDSR